jgi:hypothetical protein
MERRWMDNLGLLIYIAGGIIAVAVALLVVRAATPR